VEWLQFAGRADRFALAMTLIRSTDKPDKPGQLLGHSVGRLLPLLGGAVWIYFSRLHRLSSYHLHQSAKTLRRQCIRRVKLLVIFLAKRFRLRYCHERIHWLVRYSQRRRHIPYAEFSRIQNGR
jgi:hypothetical protein